MSIHIIGPTPSSRRKEIYPSVLVDLHYKIRNIRDQIGFLPLDLIEILGGVGQHVGYLTEHFAGVRVSGLQTDQILQ